jgi:predicted transposase YbfD/YdcC
MPKGGGKGGDYVFAVKGNQSTLRQEIADLWEGEPLPPPEVCQVSKHGGRVETRKMWTSDALVGYSDWPHLAQVCRVERTCLHKGKVSEEVAYSVTSLSRAKASPRRLLEVRRGHWGIENRLHWVRDVTFDEDRSQVRTGAAPQVMAALRNLSISLMRLAGRANIAAALRRHAAHPTEALALLANPPE